MIWARGRSRLLDMLARSLVSLVLLSFSHEMRAVNEILEFYTRRVEPLMFGRFDW